jgi:hypothetical protein
MRTLTKLRTSFWQNHPEHAESFRKTYRQNQYSATIRTAWIDYVDNLANGGIISEKLANRATL